MQRKELNDSGIRSELIAKGYIKPSSSPVKTTVCAECELKFVQLEEKHETKCVECSGANERAYRQYQNYRNNRRS